jgi:hypothetical protein
MREMPTMKMKKIKMDVERERRRHSDADEKTIRRSRQPARKDIYRRQSISRLHSFSFDQFNFCCTPRSFEKPNTAATRRRLRPPKTGRRVFKTNWKNENRQFAVCFCFRRKDGGAFDGEDKKFLRGNLPFNNRVVLADEDKAVIVGSNYKFPPESLDALRLRFNVEDYSAEPGK